MLLSLLIYSTLNFASDWKCQRPPEDFTNISFNGGFDGGGGKSVVCRDPLTKQITSVEMLDTYEARKLPPYKNIKPSRESDFISKARERVRGIKLLGASDTDNNTLEEAVTGVAHSFICIDQELEPTNDAFNVILPNKNCKIEQAARFGSEMSFYINEEIFTAMNDEQKSALLLHETLYFFNHMFFGDKDSIKTRKIVSSLMSGEKPTPYKYTPDDIPTLRCAGNSNGPADTFGTEFYVRQYSEGVKLHITSLLNHIFLDDVIYTDSDLKLDDFLTNIDANITKTNINFTESPIYGKMPFFLKITKLDGKHTIIVGEGRNSSKGFHTVTCNQISFQ